MVSTEENAKGLLIMSNVLNHYQYLHQIPEPGFKEFKTSDYVAGKLQEAGYKVIRGLGGTTGLVGEYDSGVPGPVFGIRADMDALTHIIDGKTVYIHSCGHDSHTSMLLAAAEEVMAAGTIKKGRVKFLFQPAEELGTGALKVLESGILDDVDTLFGMHIRPIQECASGEIICEMHYSASSQFTVTIKGFQAHGARPHLGINVIDAAACAIGAVNAIHLDPRVPFSVKCTRFHADSGVVNAIPDHAEITFDMRAQNNEAMQQLKEKTVNAIDNAVASVGAKVESYDVHALLPAGDRFDSGLNRIITACAEEVVGKENVVASFDTSGGEDFFHYVVRNPNVKAGFIGLGVGAVPGMHHPDMHFDLDKLENGVSMHRKMIERILG